MQFQRQANITIENCSFTNCSKAIVSDSPINMINCLIQNKEININQIRKNGDTLILIGNGLNFSLREFLDIDIKTSNFFSWKSIEFNNSKLSIEKSFPILYKKLKDVLYIDKDFDKVEKIILDAKKNIQNNNDIRSNKILLCEIEHYLMIIFSNYQKIIDDKNIEKWSWTKYFDMEHKKIYAIVSLNYDLVVEKILSNLRIEYSRIGVSNESGGIPIFKPHGSIDFWGIGIDSPISYPISNIISRNDTPIISLKRDELLMPRIEVDIVAPTQASELESFQWIKPGYDLLINHGKEVKKLIICGVSYWGCDRKEIDLIIDNINPNCEVININPDKTSNDIKEFGNKIISKIGKKRYKQINDIKELFI